MNVNSDVVNVVYKVVIIGESRTGKTSIIKRLNNQDFSENTISTVGIDFVNIFYKIDNVVVKLQIWDTAGQERFRTITKSHFRNAKAILLAFDVNKKESFERLEYWYESLTQVFFSENQINETITYVIGNKIDMNEREVSYKEGEKFASKNNLKYFEASAKTAENLPKIFETLAIDLLDYHDYNKMDRYKYTTKSDNFAYAYNLSSEISLKSDKLKPKKRYKYLFNKKKRQLKTNEASSFNLASNLKLDEAQKEPRNQFNSSVIKINELDNAKHKKNKQFLFNCCKIS